MAHKLILAVVRLHVSLCTPEALMTSILLHSRGFQNQNQHLSQTANIPGCRVFLDLDLVVPYPLTNFLMLLSKIIVFFF
jgi:hypothetical protein